MQTVEIELYGKKNRPPPRAERYKIRIDKQSYVVDHEIVSRAELLQLAGKTPPDQYKVYQKLHGGQMVEITDDTPVDLGSPGIERFVTVPLCQREG